MPHTSIMYILLLCLYYEPNSTSYFIIARIYCLNEEIRSVCLTKKDYIEERVLELAQYIIDTNSTVRAAAKKFRVSKSTVHKDVTERLLEINPGLAGEVKEVLENNKAERHLRGGMATREKYKSAREK